MKQGSVYKRGGVFWIQYYNNGKKMRESSHSENEADAGRLLHKRLGEVAEGKTPGTNFQKVRFKELMEDMRNDYRINGKNLGLLEYHFKHLEPEFARLRVPTITVPHIRAYVAKRLEEGAANATINNELAALRRALNLGCEAGKVDRVPQIKLLKEDNVRQGFFEDNEFRAVLKHLPDYLKPPVILMYYTGMRRGEVLGLTWDRVDMREGCIRLEDTKTDEPRTIYLPPEALDAVRAAYSRRRLDCNAVFFGKNQTPIRDFRSAWSTACDAAGISGRLPHDFRRTGVRNMVRAGVPEAVAMKVSGHRTRSVFERYNIVSDRDLKEAAAKVSQYVQAQNGHNFGHNAEQAE
ncbi:MAG: tyrosine-type recombinase/integrase [Candidatus Geothermincolia bacterium]